MFGVGLIALACYAGLIGTSGVRLLILYWRSREAPALLLALGYLLAGLIGWGLLLLGTSLGERGADVHAAARVLQTVGLLGMNIGTLAIAIFCWRVFDKTSPWRRALVLVLAVVLAADFVHHAITGTFVLPASSPWKWPGVAGRIATYVWMAGAGFHYYVLLRRRLRFGLVEPFVVNRVLLWGLVGAATALYGFTVSLGTVLGIWDSLRPLLLAMTIVLNGGGAVCAFLAFSPPARYLAWLQRRDARSA
jgi:hypothetical protein